MAEARVVIPRSIIFAMAVERLEARFGRHLTAGERDQVFHVVERLAGSRVAVVPTVRRQQGPRIRRSYHPPKEDTKTDCVGGVLHRGAYVKPPVIPN